MVLLLASHGAPAQTANSPSAGSGLKFEIAILDDTVRPASEVLLKLKLSNLSAEPAALFDDWWSCEFDLRDAPGNPVPQTADWVRALHERPAIVTAHVLTTLAPGASSTR